MKGDTKKRVALLGCKVQWFRSVVKLTALNLFEMVASAAKLVSKRSRPEVVTLVALAVQVGPWKERLVLFLAALVVILLLE
jgi:hypothetical protein